MNLFRDEVNSTVAATTTVLLMSRDEVPRLDDPI
jgi:hypothetical protein